MTTKITLSNVEEQLAHYYNLSTRNDFIEQALKGSGETSGKTDKSTPISKFVDLVVDLQSEGFYISYIADELSKSLQDMSQDARAHWKQQLQFYSGLGDGTPAPNAFRIRSILSATSDQSLSLQHRGGNGPNRKNIAVVLVNNIQLVPAKKNGNVISLFLNAIPSVEFSKCVPYLNVDISTGRETFEKGRLQGLSLFRFLEGAVPKKDAAIANTIRVSRGIHDKQFHGHTDDDLTNQTGMEIFLSPQTLVPAGDIQTAANVIDRFRPFMSITQFMVDVVPAMGMFAYKSGKLNLVLHDRSRLAEIADLINPNLFSNVELIIEFGWSHPDSIEQTDRVDSNVYGDLINAMRVREKYGIRNVSFDFTTNGEVSIDLDIYIKGSTQLRALDINANSKQTTQLDTITTIREVIGNLAANQNTNDRIKEIRAEQILNDAMNPNMPLIPLSQEQREELRRLSKHTNPDIARIRKLIEKLYGSSSKGVGLVGAALTDSRRRMETMMKNLFIGADPFFYDHEIDEQELPAVAFQSQGGVKPREMVRAKYLTERITTGKGKLYSHASAESSVKAQNVDFVSIGKLLTQLVAQPLISSGQFNEVQILTYPLNESAGLSAGMNIANFPVAKDQFIDRFSTMLAHRNNTRVSIAEFMTFMNNAFFDDSANSNYGMYPIFRASWNDKTLTVQNDLTKWAESEIERTAKTGGTLQSFIATFMKTSFGMNNGVFIQPHVDVIVEAYPVNEHESDTILRIHVFDSTATPHSTLQDLLAAHRGDKLFNATSDASNRIAEIAGDDANGLKSMQDVRTKLIQQLEAIDASAGLHIFEKSVDSIRVKGGASAIKELVMQSAPSIIYGSQNTAVISAQLSSVQIPQLSTVHMLRHGVGGSTTPVGQGPGGLPLLIIPTQLEMTTFGCPLLMYGQQFFIDFGTNTTADNIYAIIKLTHEIHPGGFQSKISFWPIDAYGQYRSPFTVLDGLDNVLNQRQLEQDTVQK